MRDLYHALFGPPEHLRGVRLVPKIIPAETWTKVEHSLLAKTHLGCALIYEARDLYTDDLLAQLQPEFANAWLTENGLTWRPGSSHIYDLADEPGLASRVLGLGGQAAAWFRGWTTALLKERLVPMGRAVLRAGREYFAANH